MASSINVPVSVQVQNDRELTQRIQTAMNAARLNLGNGSRAFSSLSQPLGRLTGQADEFSKSMEAANARVLAFGASVGVVNAVSNAFKALVSSTIEVEKALKEISIVGDQFGGDIKNLGNGIFDIAKKTGQGFAEVSKAALEFARQGLNMEETLQRTQDALILTRTTGLDAAKSVEGLTAAVNGFSKAGLTTAQILNKLAAVDQAFAVSSADLIEGFNRSAAVAQNAGVTFDELAGIITALQQETSRGGAVIGNALKTIFTRLQDTSTLTQLQDLGVAVTDLQGNLLPARQILQNLATDLQGLGQITKAGIFKDVAGTFQINQLISLVGDLNKEQSVAAAATRKSASATNEAYVANEKLNQSLDAILNKVAQTGKQLGSILGELGLSDSLKGILETINSFLDGANKLLQGDDIGSKFAKGFVKGIGSVLTGPGLLVIGAVIVKLSADLLKFGAQSLKVFFGIGQAAREQKQVQESIVQTLLSNQSVLNTILNTQGGQNAQALKFLGILNQQQAAMRDIQTLAAGIAGTTYGAGYRAGPGGLARRSAGGYLPAQEAADVRRGVGGASPSSKVVAIPNFAFGGGKRGTMIANTSEYIVPNYAGGGSAIFNQDMVNSMGLPAGAKKISAAGGFIPNFAATSSKPYAVDASGEIKTGSTKKKITDSARDYALIVNDATKKPALKYFPAKGSDNQYLALVAGINSEKIMQDAQGGAFKDSRFTSQALVKKYTDLAIKDASDYSSAVIGKPIAPVTVQKLSNPGVASGLVGAIFENGIAAAIDDPKMLQALADRDPNAPFDFIQGKNSSPSLNKFFGINTRIKNIEAKYSLTPTTAESFGEKIDKDWNRKKQIVGIAEEKPEKLPPLPPGRPLMIRSDADAARAAGKTGPFSFSIQGSKVSAAAIQRLINAGGVRASAGGYIPNFAGSFFGKGKTIAEVLNQVFLDGLLDVNEAAAILDYAKIAGPAVAGKLKDAIRAKLMGGKKIQPAAQVKLAQAGFLPPVPPRNLSRAAAEGFMPNFAASALQQAIAREKSAGLSSSQIYVDQNPSLKSPLNPMGLMVANTRDEPFGGAQGIARARKEGANPKTYGAAGGFVPNYVNFGVGTVQGGQGSKPAPSLNLSGTNTPAGNPNPTDKVNKGFADMAGKIFLVQSALSFLSGSIGDNQDSFSKLTNQVVNTVGNLGSLALLGQQLASTNPAGALGKFGKQLGLVGIVAAGLYEGLKGGVAFINEYSGANDQAAKSLLKFDSALGDVSIKLENFSPTTQKSLEIRGKEAIKGIELPRPLFQTSLNEDPEFLRKVGQVAATGTSPQEIQSIVENVSSQNLDPTTLGLRANINNTIDALYKAFAQAAEKNSEKVNPLLLSIKNLKAEDLVPENINKLIVSNLGESALANQNLLDIVNDTVKARQKELSTSIEQQKVQANITFGERLTTEIAKKRLDSALEIIKLKIQETTSEEESIQLRMETLDLSNREKIIDEARLKILESQKKAQTDIVDSIAAAVDKAQGSSINVSVEDLDKLKTKLESIDFANLTDADFDALATELGGENGAFKIGIENAKNLLNSVKEERSERARLRAVTENQINAERDRKLKIDDINQSLNTQLSTIQRIAQTAQSIAGLNISVTGVDIAKNESEITRLQSLLNDPNRTEAEKEGIQKQIIGLQKINNELKKQNDLQKYNADYADIGAKILEKQTELNLAKNLDQGVDQNRNKVAQLESDLQNLIRDQASLTNNYDSSVISIDAQTKALSDQEKIIGQVTGAYVELQNQLLSFQKGAGGRIAGAELGILSATDPTSLATATIQRKVEMEALGKGLQGQDYYKFVTQGVELEKKRFELSSETSNVRRVELQNELDLMNQISEISAATDEERLAKIKEIIQARTEENQSFGAGFTRGIATLRDKTENFKSEIGQQIPELFASNLAQGLNDALSGAKSLKAALQDAAISFLNAISQASMQNLANKLVVGISGLGNIGKASGGLIKGGSGTKDDVPAMLMGGEYVIKKSAVNKYGSSFLNALNKGQVKGFANGGGVQSGAGGFYVPGDYGEGSIRGKSQLLAFAGQSFTSGQYDQMGGFGSSGAFVNLEAESARLTTLGRENSPLFERVQQTKEEAFKVYLEQLNQEKQYRDQLKQFEEAQKQREKQLTSALIQAAASVALNVVGSAAASGFKNAAGIAKANNQGIGGQFTAGLGGIFKGGGGQGGLGNLFSGNFSAAFNSGKNIYGGTDNKQYMGYTLGNKSYPYQKRASGGYISGGSGVRDDVPAMLTGGEFVLNNRATRKLGVQNLNRLNSGESGGGEDRSAAVTESLLSKLDELIQATRESSGDNVVVNVSSSEAGNASNENGGGNERDLQRKIRAAVLEVIAQEKRLGGSLNKNNR